MPIKNARQWSRTQLPYLSSSPCPRRNQGSYVNRWDLVRGSGVRAECTFGETKGGWRLVVINFFGGVVGFFGFLSGLRIWLFACVRG